MKRTSLRQLLASTIFLILSGGLLHAQDYVVTGPSPLFESQTISPYLRGITSGSTSTPELFRIVGIRRSPAGITIEGLLLDVYGNYLPPASGSTWQAVFGCRGESLARQVTPIIEQRLWSPEADTTDFVILIDNSLTSDGLARDVVRSLNNILPGLVGGDRAGVIVFDHNINEIAPLSPMSVTASRCIADSIAAFDGLAGVNNALMHGLRAFSDPAASTKAADRQRSLILITSSNDATSLSITSADIVTKARETGAVINVIKIGHNAHGYVYRYITAATGGRLYSLERSRTEDAASIVREIAYARKQHLEIFLPLTDQDMRCDDVLFKVGLQLGDTLLADTIMLPIRERAFRTTNAVVAAFRDTNEVGIQDYYSLLALIAEDLMADSTRALMLVGHVSGDVKGDHMERGLQRAGYVADFLKAYGVKDKQLQTRSDGSLKPKYFLQLDGTQRLLNNRVEAYFLRASDLPYTITVGQYATEAQAEESVTTWQDRGFKAYFDPVVVKREPAYQVKLWGYGTREEAERDAALARSKYKQKNAYVD